MTIGVSTYSHVILLNMKNILEKLFAGGTLSEPEACETLTRITTGAVPEAQVAGLLAAYRMRPVTTEELLGFRQSLIDSARPIDLSSFHAIDIVGTGGDGKNTFNISTCACFVIAGAGYHVAKHGNFGASSVSGASTVLQQHGVKFTHDESRLHRSIEECGVAYLHAPLFHPALGAVGPLRRTLGFKTFFNLLGPLVNPCHPAAQLLGVADLVQLRLYRDVLVRLQRPFCVVTSLDGYDEISLTTDFKVATNHGENLFRPDELGLEHSDATLLSGGSQAEDAAEIFDRVLDGTAEPSQRNTVLVNAAFGIRLLSQGRSLAECLDEARVSLESGRAKARFKHFVEINS